MSKNDPIQEVADLALRSPGVAGLIAVLAACFAFAMLRIHSPVGDLMPRIAAFVNGCVALMMAITALVGWQASKSDRRPLPHSLREILRLSPRQFETLVANLFRSQGYRVEEVGGHGQGDGGIDLIMRRDADPHVEHLVQCKKYGSGKRVNVSEVRDFIGAMALHRTRCQGLIVTSGTLTEDAQSTAAAVGPSLRIIAGDELSEMLRKRNPLASAAKIFTSPTPSSNPPPPLCPSCHLPMLRKIAGPGRHQGNPFWGCPNYPNCKEIIDAS